MDRIDKYIEEQKRVEHSPYLASRIVAKVADFERGQNAKIDRMPLWQYPAIAAGLAFVAALGIAIGGSYLSPKSNPTGILVNDTYIEQLTMYGEDADE
jgi:hypothetical protein